MDLKITRLDETAPAVLYKRYPSEQAPQACWILLDLRDGSVEFAYNPESMDGARPATVYDGVVRAYTVPFVPTAAGANEILDRIAPLLTRALAGSEVTGTRPAVGAVTEDGAEAEDEIRDVLWAYDEWPTMPWRVVGMSAAEWWSEGADLPDGLTADSTDADVERIADEQASAAATAGEAGYTVLEGAYEYLIARRDEMRQTARD